MAVEDIEWQERYGDQSYKPRSLFAIRVALLSLFFSQMVVLPSLAVYLSSLHADTTMLGYCLGAKFTLLLFFFRRTYLCMVLFLTFYFILHGSGNVHRRAVF